MLCWIFDQFIPDCLGVSIRRIDVATGKKQPLPSWVPFEGQDNSEWKAHNTDEWPVQKFTWKDMTAEAGMSVQYEIVPMVGTPGNLVAKQELATLTNQVSLTTEHRGGISYVSNHGILSTQALAHKLPTDAEGKPDWQALVTAIRTPGNPIREKLSSGIGKMLMEPLLTAKAEGGRVCAAVYELSDPEIVDCFVQNADALSIILGNAGKEDDTNKDSRARLHAAGADITDRILPDSELPHNKLYVRKDKTGKAVAATLLTANATPTGLCAQANAGVRILNDQVAQVCLEYWERLRADGAAQSAELRAANARMLPEIVLADGKTRVQVFFSPNMQERMKPKTGAPTPPDMAYIFNLMENVKQMYAFLAFYPGFPSIISKTEQIAKQRPDLWIRGAVSSPQALPKGTQLFHRAGEPPVMLPASEINEPFGNFINELLKAGPDAHSIIHSKTMAGDVFVPQEEDCWCTISSHNLGFKASYQNDEVIFVIRGNRSVALAVFVHIMYVYDHYRFRWLKSRHKSNFSGFLAASADWQNKYQIPGVRKELEMFTGVVLP